MLAFLLAFRVSWVLKGQHMPLTDATIRAAKLDGKTVNKLSDGQGLQLWVTAGGGKLWNLAYRFNGKAKKLAIGAYPAIGLADARKKRDEAKALLASGIDPGQHKRIEKANKAQAAEHTFASMAAKLLDKKRREGKASATIGKREWLYGLAGDTFGAQPIASIAAPDVLAVLRKVEAKGLLETAKRMRSAIGEVFRFSVAEGVATTDPTGALRGALAAPKVKHRAAITEAKAFGELLRAIDGFTGQPTTKAALQLMAYLFPRPGELRMAEWSEFDLAGAVWTIPASRTKMRRIHRVPLPRQAIAVLEALQPYSAHQALVFPAIGRGLKPISENTMNAALRRMGFGPDDMTSHGFRAAASTLLNESGRFSVDAIERALAHQDADAVRRAYARGEHWKERVAMAQWWADQLDAWREGGKVVPMRTAQVHPPERR
jgi:integrase